MKFGGCVIDMALSVACKKTLHPVIGFCQHILHVCESTNVGFGLCVCICVRICFAQPYFAISAFSFHLRSLPFFCVCGQSLSPGFQISFIIVKNVLTFCFRKCLSIDKFPFFLFPTVLPLTCQRPTALCRAGNQNVFLSFSLCST